MATTPLERNPILRRLEVGSRSAAAARRVRVRSGRRCRRSGPQRQPGLAELAVPHEHVPQLRPRRRGSRRRSSSSETVPSNPSVASASRNGVEVQHALVQRAGASPIPSRRCSTGARGRGASEPAEASSRSSPATAAWLVSSTTSGKPSRSVERLRSRGTRRPSAPGRARGNMFSTATRTPVSRCEPGELLVAASAGTRACHRYGGWIDDERRAGLLGELDGPVDLADGSVPHTLRVMSRNGAWIASIAKAVVLGELAEGSGVLRRRVLRRP